jgi:RNA polymerase sigma factor (sigma-70 family)
MMTDKDIDGLVEKAKVGDKTAEEQLFSYLIVRFRTFATFRARADDKEDITMDACKVVMEKYKMREFTGEGGFKLWAQQIFRNVLNNHYRSSSVRNKVLTQEPESYSESESTSEPDHELRQTLYACIKKMIKAYPRYARIINLAYQGYETEEICEKLNIQRNNCYVMLKRGREMLKVCIETGSF